MKWKNFMHILYGHQAAWAVLSTLLLGAMMAVAETDTPLQKMRQTIDGLVAILTDETLQAPARAQERRAKIRQVLSQRFAYEAMAQQALGQHWGELTLAQRREFVPLFSDLLERRHSQRIEKYGGTAKSVVFQNETIGAQGNATVRIEIVDPRDPTTTEEVAYRLQQQNGDWYVHDLLIEKASMVTNFRTQFDRIIRQESYPELVRRLKMSTVSGDREGK